MRIVEQARSEQAATSGALHGGRLAGFLAAEPEGRDMVRALAEDRPAPAPVVAPTPVEPAKPDLSELLSSAPAPVAPEPPRTARPEAPKGPVDRGLLDRLVDGDEGRGT